MYPVSRADALVGGSGAGAEVELLNWETLVVEADAVCPAGRPVLDISQVCVSIDQHMTAAGQETRQSFLQNIATVLGCSYVGVLNTMTQRCKDYTESLVLLNLYS